MKKLRLKITYSNGKESIKLFTTKKGVDIQFKRLSQPNYIIFDGEEYTSKYTVELLK